MKRILLPLLFSTAVVAGHAQQMKPEKVRFDAKAMFEKNNHVVEGFAAKSEKDAKKIVHRSKANGVYYTKSETAMWSGESIEGSFYYTSYLILPPYKMIYFNDKSSVTGTTWTWYDDPVEYGILGSSGCYQTNGYNIFGDTPVISDGKNSFSLADLNQNWVDADDERTAMQKQNPDYFGAQMMKDSLTNMVFFDATHSPDGGLWGICQPDEKTNYLFGNGYVSTEKANYQIAGFSQFYPNPHGLYLTSAHSMVYTMTQPLTGDARLVMSFYNVETDENGEEVIGDKLLGRFFATAGDQVKIDGPYQTKFTSTGSVNIYSLEFKNEYQDEIGSWISEPVILNEKFVMMITGFDQEGVDVNFGGVAPQAEEDFDTQTDILVWTDAEKQKGGSFAYSSLPLVIDVTFTGLFDYANVLATGFDEQDNEYPNLNVLKVSADGKTVTDVNGNPEVNYVVAYTAYPWLDHEGIENYYYELPEWISDLAFQEAPAVQRTNREDRDGSVFLQPLCDPLPGNVAGRFAVIYLEGKGYVGDNPIIVLQGNATLEEALAAIEATGIQAVGVKKQNTNSAATYNLTGQKVNGNFRGLTIRNGKKFMVK